MTEAFDKWDFEGWAIAMAEHHEHARRWLGRYDRVDHAALHEAWRLVAEKIQQRDWYGLRGVVAMNTLSTTDNNSATILLIAALEEDYECGTAHDEEGWAFGRWVVPAKREVTP